MRPNTGGLLYCRGTVKRTFDIVLSGTALIVLSPLFAFLVLLQFATSGRPVLFMQQRVGRGGATFTLFKFRTMRIDQRGGPPVTAGGDRRVTPSGRLLRASKLDELPQLLNILAGKMSIVGPRPELPDYVKLYTDRQRQVLEVRPGLTDPATLRYRNEERILAAVDPAQRESYYIQTLMPEKLELNLTYVEQAGLLYDTLLILRTLGAIAFPPKQ